MAVGLIVSSAQAEWQPKGPIKLWIGFGAGGGTDTQARSLAAELENLRGWRIIPENKAGGGGAVMAASLKNAPADGQTIGLRQEAQIRAVEKKLEQNQEEKKHVR
ncbi:hypothetical protein CEE37_15100 [candidate division LCP-89 bacterium B3_LCP]|uniref:Tripartite tricarboxylate transporter substrate-binding protein n=1 Tax=candidate division LCP-89 bacterium B3_LCP TaxID=2012998 RepID=A0A532UN98_UNCL8|nr:MAG: hypothetical protein CEE37_15100 [candidate division LCP-89 bacterium B3_LCP]